MGFLIISDEQKLPKTDDVYEINNSEDINHIKKLLLREEDLILRVIVLGKGKTTARIKKVGINFVNIIVDNEKFIKGCKKKVSIALGGLRPVMAKRVIEHSTTLGVKEIHFFPSDYSVKSYFESNVFKNKKYLKYMSRGLSQSENYDTFPILTIHDSFHEIGFEKYSKVCFLNKGVDGTYFSKVFVEYENILLLFGPEKGWSKNEINQFKNMGFDEIIISESILRVEFAVNAALSQLEILRNST